MKLLDVNIVVGDYRADHAHHDVIHPWFTDVGESGEPFGVPSAVWASFIRLVTSHRVFERPSPPGQAFEYAKAVIGRPSYLRIEPGPRHLELFEGLCDSADARGNLVTDAYLGAVALEHDAELVSMDRDFARFEGLRWSRPI